MPFEMPVPSRLNVLADFRVLSPPRSLLSSPSALAPPGDLATVFSQMCFFSFSLLSPISGALMLGFFTPRLSCGRNQLMILTQRSNHCSLFGPSLFQPPVPSNKIYRPLIDVIAPMLMLLDCVVPSPYLLHCAPMPFSSTYLSSGAVAFERTLLEPSF